MGEGRQAPEPGGKWAAQRMFRDISADEVDSAGSLLWTENTEWFLVGREEARVWWFLCPSVSISSQPKFEVFIRLNPPWTVGSMFPEFSYNLHPVSACKPLPRRTPAVLEMVHSDALVLT